MERRKKPYLWVTWICGLVSADENCEWKSWFKGWHRRLDSEKRRESRENSLDLWKADHARLVRDRTDALIAQGWKVYVEDQNGFTYKGVVADVGAKPDIVALMTTPNGGKARIEDCKTGREKPSDFWQVCTYMNLAPKCLALDGLDLVGAVVYRDRVREVSRDEAKAAMVNIVGQIRVVASETEPRRVPTVKECARCDVRECPDRIEESTDDVEDDDAPIDGAEF